MNISIKQKIASFIGAAMIALAAVVVPVVPVSVSAATKAECEAAQKNYDSKTQQCTTSTATCTSGNVSGGINAGLECTNSAGTPDDLFGGNSVFTVVVNILLFLIGAVSVIMLIWGGIRYTTSAGNAASVTSAKNTIMYAIIGLIVAFLAYAIVNWVLSSLGAAQ